MRKASMLSISQRSGTGKCLYLVLPRDEASKMELAKVFHMPAVPGPRFTPVQEHG